MAYSKYAQFSDEISFALLFVSVITVNKYVLSVLRFTEPTVFQGWQTLVCIILLSVLIKFEKIQNELQSLERKTVYIVLPILVCFTLSIVAGSIALANLPVPVFLALTNLIPAVLILLEDKLNGSSLKTCGSIAICGTVVTLLVLTLERWGIPSFLWMFLHIVMNILSYIYIQKMCLGHINHITKTYYNNFFSVAVLVPISIYLDVLHLPRPITVAQDVLFYSGCLLSGILGTFLQLWTGRVQPKHTYFHAQGLAKLACAALAHLLFSANIEPMEWLLITLNLMTGTFVLNLEERDLEVVAKSWKPKVITMGQVV